MSLPRTVFSLRSIGRLAGRIAFARTAAEIHGDLRVHRVRRATGAPYPTATLTPMSPPSTLTPSVEGRF